MYGHLNVKKLIYLTLLMAFGLLAITNTVSNLLLYVLFYARVYLEILFHKRPDWKHNHNLTR